MERVMQDQREFLCTKPSALFGVPINSDEENQAVYYGMKFVESLKKQFNSLEKMCSEDAAEIPTVLDTIDNSDAEREQLLDTFQWLDKLAELQHRSLPPDNPLLAIIYNNYGSQRCSVDGHSMALLCYEKALDNILNRLPNNYQLLAKTYSNMATELDHLERRAEAINYAAKAVQTAQSAFGMHHEDIIFYQNQLQELQRQEYFSN